MIAKIRLLATVVAASLVSARPNFSWETLPVFFHGANVSGPWSVAASKQISRFAMATNEKSHGMQLPGGGSQSEEIGGPAACRQINAENTTTDTFFYLNSVIDWPFNFKLHGMMITNPSWRLKNTSGGDCRGPGDNWLYNLTNDEMRAAWVAECVTAAKNGCTGCFIDQANVAQGIQTWPASSPVAMAYRIAHLATLTELDAALAPIGGYSIYNHLGVTTYNTSAMMIEDFAGTEKCITTLQTVASRGLTVQAHAGNFPEGNTPAGTCVHGDTNSLAAFLIGAGNYSYYHCGWGHARTGWPSVPDPALDWLPEYDLALGAPLGLAKRQPSSVSGANASLWRRAFASGTHVEFDGGNGKGAIHWASGLVQEPGGPFGQPYCT
jgi:hypothetical protein